jgi:hypothetical protein
MRRSRTNSTSLVKLSSLAVFLGSLTEAFQSPSAAFIASRRTIASSLQASESNSDSFLAELRERQQQLEQSNQQRASKWRQVTHCKSGTVLILPDWVRRVAVDYPLIATGSAAGEVFVGNAETNQILTSTARGRKSSSSKDEEQGNEGAAGVDELLLEQTCRVLYGSYDGGGTIAIAFDSKLIVDAPRTGGVRLHRVVKDKESVALLAQGVIPALEGVLVTCVDLQPDYLLVGTASGQVHAYALEDETPLFLQSKPRYEWNLAAVTTASGPSPTFGGCCPITSLSPCPELQCVVATTAASSVQVLSIPDDDDDDDEDEQEMVSSRRQELQPVASFYPPFDSTERKATNVFCLSAAVVKRVDSNGTASYSIVCGGNDGSLYVQPLNVQRGSSTTSVELALTSPLFPLRPFHNGPVMAITSPAQGLAATVAQDGTLRMYDVGSQTRYSRILFQFAGYKVWVGSLCVANGDKLYTDGADNQVIGHHFRGKAAAEEESNESGEQNK